MQHKLASNSISSIGISSNNELLAWGSNKYFILGQKRVNSNATVPAYLKLPESSIAVIDVSLGEFHAVCMGNDKYTNGIPHLLLAVLTPLNYVKDLLVEMRERIGELGLAPGDVTKPGMVTFEEDLLRYAQELMRQKLENCAGKAEEDCEYTYSVNEPLVTKRCFCLYLQNRLKIMYKNFDMMGKFLGDIEAPGKEEFVNIREIRDQICLLYTSDAADE
eukprot:TRINITY_DN16272_c0_g2_i2.p1 TRINITY_DN16272_c0_g2~~TRINITY_DN16272_c0_g2_i2.p1  ORF type:complete len:219 (+),score=63.60 TRINITY_DN16272_c0_g2_i2:56-712(+)